ncbi:glycerol-3-phosphate dehydrogenase [Alteromonadaceae bacterium M269]|nr:glycerol-3-phosphate dehydrogenase [Alteromonadaceae bacterium M269]
MAFPTAVNSQITDSISQVNTKVLGDAPAIATNNFMLATSQALSNAAHNATSNQQNMGITAQASLVQSVDTLLSINTATTGKATVEIFQ